MVYGDFKNLLRRTASDEVLRDKEVNIAKKPKYDGYQRGLASMVYDFFHEKSFGGAVAHARLEHLATQDESAIKCQVTPNQELAEELQKPIIRKLGKNKVYSSFRDNICGADLVDIQLISKFNKGFRFSSCVNNIFSKYA